VKFEQKIISHDKKDPRLVTEMQYVSGAFRIIVRDTGVMFSGDSEWVYDMQDMQDFAKALSEAYKNHCIMFERKKGQLIFL